MFLETFEFLLIRPTNLAKSALSIAVIKLQ
jgi:hypothetical protein